MPISIFKRRSPCVGICQYDPEAELCVGCFRNFAEISDWGDLPPEEQQRIMQEELPQRAKRYSQTFETRYR